MTEKQIEKILQQGENFKIEFKKRINKELASEICAFSNSLGGVILLGVDDNNIVTGLETDNNGNLVYEYLSKFNSVNLLYINKEKTMSEYSFSILDNYYNIFTCFNKSSPKF